MIISLKEALLEEHSKRQVLLIVKFIGDDKIRFKELMAFVFGDDELLSQRAAWVLKHCYDSHPQLIRPYFKKIIEHLKKKNMHDAVKRSMIYALQNEKIPEKLQGEVYDMCLKFALSINESIAVKVFSITVLHKIALPYPELRNELKVILTDLVNNSESPAVLNRAGKILADFNKKRSKV